MRFSSRRSRVPDGSFTMEAMVNLPTGLGTGTYEIFCTDNSLNDITKRGFQFRLNGASPQSLEFNFIGTTGTTSLFASIPTTGPHALAAGQWYPRGPFLRWSHPHFDDSTGPRSIPPPTPPIRSEPRRRDHQRELSAGHSSSATKPAQPQTDTKSSEGLRGLMDEARISRVVRGASDFIFYADTDNDDLADSWEILHFKLPAEDPVTDLVTILARQDGTGNPDLDAYNNETEETAGSDPNNINSVPGLISMADGTPRAWEIAEFGNLGQTATGDPDNDYNTNAAEYAASTNPESDTSWPDTDDGIGDGLNDGWEIHFFTNITAYADIDDPDNDGFTNCG